MRVQRQARFLTVSSCLFLLLAACLLAMYAALAFSPERHFHCCEPTGLSFAQLSAATLPLPLLLALSGLFGCASVRSARVPATLLHLLALLLLAGHALLLAAAAFAGRDRALQVAAWNFQLVRDCRTDWLVERLQAGLDCSGWNRTTADRSVCPPAGVNGSAAAATATGPCRERVARLAARAAGGALAAGMALAAVALLNLGCQCSHQWKISDPTRRASAAGRLQRQRPSRPCPTLVDDRLTSVPLTTPPTVVRKPKRPPPPPPNKYIDDDGAV